MTVRTRFLFCLDYGEVIGHGTYGFVRKAVNFSMQQTVVAVKEVKPGHGTGVPLNACREIGMLRELSHPHIVNLLNVIINSETKAISLVLEWAEYDLKVILGRHMLEEKAAHALGRQQGMIPLSMTRAIMFQLLDATEYLHANWVFHRDIKPANVLITAEGQVKLADFGLARRFHCPLRPLADDATVVTKWYRAPELLFGTRHYTPAIDVWALGAVFAELILGFTIFVPPGERKDQKEELISKDQILKIFSVLGMPDAATVWPTLSDMPFWTAVVHEWPELKSLKPYAEMSQALRQQISVRLAGAPRPPSPTERLDCINLLMAMLTYNPTARISSRDAKEAPFFANPAGLRGNVLAEVSQTWRSFYPQREKCACDDCRKREESGKN